jgi:hypothetical protein
MASRRPFGFKQSVSVKDMREQRLLDAKAATGISQKKQRKTPSLSENRRPKIQAPPPRGERLRVVKAVQEKRKVKGERDMSYQVGQAVMVGGMGAGTGLYAQPTHERPTLPVENKHHRKFSREDEEIEKNAEADALRRELVSLQLEHDAREQMVELLTKKISVLEREVESGKLDQRQLERKTRDAEDEVDRFRQQTVLRENHENQLEAQVEQLREDLEDERRVNAQKERQLLASAQALREAQAETYRARQAAAKKDDGMAQLVEDEKARNAGLLRVVQERDGAMVALTAERKALQSKVAELQDEVERLNGDVDAEREWREKAQDNAKEECLQNKKLRVKIASLLEQLAKEEDYRATAIARAEAATKLMKRMKQEATVEENKDDLAVKKEKSLKDQITLRERRIKLMRVQMEQEKKDHNALKKKQDEVKNAYDGVRITLKASQRRIVELEKLLYKTRPQKRLVEAEVLDSGGMDEYDRATAGDENPESVPKLPIPKNYDASKLPGSDAPMWMQM